MTARIVSLAGDNEAQFAKKAGISDQAFRKYLKRSIPGGENILKIAIAGNVTTDWLLTGGGPKYRNIDNPEGCPIQCDEEMKKLCDKVKFVIDAIDLSYSNSLKDNINSFHEAVKENRERKEEKKKAAKERRISFEAQTHMKKEIADLRTTVFDIQKQLKHKKKDIQKQLEHKEKTSGLGPSSDTD